MTTPESLRDWLDLTIRLGFAPNPVELEWTGTTAPNVFADAPLPIPELTELAQALRGQVRRTKVAEPSNPARVLGRRMTEVVFGGSRAQVLATARETARSRGAGLCLRIVAADDPVLVDLPWELLGDTDISGRPTFLALDPAVCIVRGVVDPGALLVARQAPRVGIVTPPSDAPLRLVADLLLGTARAALDRWQIVEVQRSASGGIPLPSEPLDVLVDTTGTVGRVEAGVLAATVPVVVAVHGAGVSLSDNALGALVAAIESDIPVPAALTQLRRLFDFTAPGSNHWASVTCHLSGSGPLIVTADPEPAVRSAASEGDLDHDALVARLEAANRATLLARLDTFGGAAPRLLREQASRLGME